MVHGSRLKPLWHFWVHRASLLCCCKRTDQADQNLVQGIAEEQTGVRPQMEYLGLGNGKGRQLRTKHVQLGTTRLEYWCNLKRKRFPLTWLHGFLLQFLLLSWKCGLRAETLVVASLVLVGNILWIHLIVWRNWGVHIEHLTEKVHSIKLTHSRSQNQSHSNLTDTVMRETAQPQRAEN